MKITGVILLFCTGTLFIQAQTIDTSLRYSPKGVSFVTEQGYLSSLEFNYLDTLSQNIQEYNPQRTPYNSYLGNLGSPIRSLIYSPYRKESFDLGINAFDAYLLKPADVSYYHTYSPYSELYYTMGAKQEQKMGVKHFQNVSPNFNLGLDYQKIASEGLYTRQNTNYSNFAFSSWVGSEEHRYRLFLSYVFNRARVQENGGVVGYDTLFTSELLLSKQAAAVELTDAENRLKSHNMHVTQVLDFGPKESVQINDSTQLQMIVPKFRLVAK